MMKNSMKSLSNIPYGTAIKGKWNKNTYTLLKQLGYGANGVVYLADCNGKKVALKMSDQNVTITSETNVLKSFSKAQGVTLGPSLLDVDDWITTRGLIPFYVMEYIEGKDFLTFIKDKGKSWIDVLVLQLLSDLDNLHEQGWVFGDLKPENIIVTGPPIKIRTIDVGGTTIQGRAIKEFTEFYDRGYWGLGSRKAEPSYDLFAAAMIIINAFYPYKFSKQPNKDGLTQIKEKIDEKPELRKHKHVLLKALAGEFQTAGEMRKHFLQSTNGISNSGTMRGSKKTSANRKNANQIKNQSRTKKKGKPRVLETILLLFLVSFLYALYILDHVM